jgi:hypothetical protein
MLFRRPTRSPQPPPRVQPKPEPVAIRFLDDLPPPPPPTPPPPSAPKEAAALPPARRRREWPIGTLAFLTVLGGGLVLRSAGIPGVGQTVVEEEISNSFSVGDRAKVVVDTFNGPIEVSRGESHKVDCLVTRRTSGRDREDAEADLKNISVTMTREGDTITVAARRIAGFPRNNVGASARIRVPDGTDVRLKSSNGRLSVEGVEGAVDAHTSNGQVNVKSGTGRLTLASTNGGIHCEASDAVVLAETSNGPIEFRGLLAPGGSSFHSSNGRVTVKLPSRLAFRVDAKTSNGKISSDFDFEPGRGSKGRTLVGSTGENAKVSLKVRTSNGGVRILHDED